MLFDNVLLLPQNCALCTQHCPLSFPRLLRPFRWEEGLVQETSQLVWESVWEVKEVEMELAATLASFMCWRYRRINVHGFTLAAGCRQVNPQQHGHNLHQSLILHDLCLQQFWVLLDHLEFGHECWVR